MYFREEIERSRFLGAKKSNNVIIILTVKLTTNVYSSYINV